ncbi:serine hydrolase [Crocinitomicaceae bacterium]|nr:serine hydrolase [Crocinitomicaceae bacterium]
MFKFFLAAFILFLTSSILAQELSSEQIDSIVNSAMHTSPHAGVAVVIVKDGKIIHEKGYGVTSVKTKEKVDEHTRFGIASNSKAFTATALAMLVDAGKIDWNDKVIDYLPEFKTYDPFVTANYTITDLLCHRSGLGLGAGDLMWFPDGNDYTMEEILGNFQYQTSKSSFRTKYDYNNLMFIVAGEIVARVSGMSWSDFIENEIMKPLDMNESAGKQKRLKNQNNVAVPHSLIEGKLVPLSHMEITQGEAAAGIYASVHDLGAWMVLNLNNGTWKNRKIVSEKNHNFMWRPHTNINFNTTPKGHYKSKFKAYGLGWSVDDYNGYTVIGHGGGLPGMLSKTRMIPEIGVGVVVLTNAAPGGYSYEMISRSIIDGYLGIEKVDWVTLASNWISQNQEKEDSVLNAVSAVVQTAKYSEADLEAIVGTYTDSWFGNITISLDHETLYIKSERSPKLSGEILYYNDSKFVINWEYTDMECSAFAYFSYDENGKANEITMEGISPNIDFSFDFHDLKFTRTD